MGATISYTTCPTLHHPYWLKMGPDEFENVFRVKKPFNFDCYFCDAMIHEHCLIYRRKKIIYVLIDITQNFSQQASLPVHMKIKSHTYFNLFHDICIEKT